MLSFTLFEIFEWMRAAHMIKSERQFATVWLGMSASYMTDLHFRLHCGADISRRTTSTFRQRILLTARFLPKGLAEKLGGLVEEIDRSSEAATALRR